MGTNDEDWPEIELYPARKGILSKFTTSTSETVASVLVRELVLQIEQPSSNITNTFSTDQELEWIMQVIDHGLTLPFSFNQISYDTIRSAVHIYLTWISALTNRPHSSCPKQLIVHPDRYFRKIIESFRHLFQNKCVVMVQSNNLVYLSQQGTQIKIILTHIESLLLGSTLMDEYKDEIWSRCLIFLINVTDQLLSIQNCKSHDNIGFLMANHICTILFDCWNQAAFNELIPSYSYWRTLSSLASRCGSQVQFIESWAKSLLNTTIILLHNLYGQPIDTIHDGHFFESLVINSVPSSDKLCILKNLWHNLFVLLGNPTHFTINALLLCESQIIDQYNMNFFIEQITCSYFLIILTFKKLIDLLIGDQFVSINFNESEELHALSLKTAENETMEDDKTVETANSLEREGGNMFPNSTQQIVLNYTTYTDPKDTGKQNSNEMNALHIMGRYRGGQHLWYILKNNPFNKDQSKSYFPKRFSTTSLLDVSLEWLYESALYQQNLSNLKQKFGTLKEDGVTQKSNSDSGSGSSLLNSCGVEKQLPQQQQFNGTRQAHKFITLRQRSHFDNSSSRSNSSFYPESSQMIETPQQFAVPTEFPSVDGISSGRATAISALCRIVCSKSSRENFSEEQLARFLTILHEALLSRDRLVLCSLLFYSSNNLFKLSIRGIQILLPNYLAAIDIIFTESLKISLHPSISPNEMRSCCLKALASILSWPSVFGSRHILEQKTPLGKAKKLSRQGSSNNFLEPELQYIDLRPRMQKFLVFSLRNETDPMNIQYALGLSTLFCIESARYGEGIRIPNDGMKKDEGDQTTKNFFANSLIRSIISAICDKLLCKHAWSKDTLSCLAAFDCLNSLSTIQHAILFHNDDYSTGSLILNSLCRFIDQQLQKPPPHHSRDMHSTVVAAYFCMSVWLNAAPALANIESCLNTIAQTIEFGMTGGQNMTVEQYKPASQRVHDSAESLLHTLFSKTNRNLEGITNEIELTEKFGLQLDKFQHFLVNQSTLVSLHEAQHIYHLSKGLPTVIAIFRTPFYDSFASFVQLVPVPQVKSLKSTVKLNDENGETSQTPTNSTSITNLTLLNENGKIPVLTDEQENTIEPKQFEIPTEIFQPQCKLDTHFPKLYPVPPQVQDVEERLAQIRAQFAQGSMGDRDSRNVWLNTSLGAIFSQPPTPASPVAYCNSMRIFLNDMGLINRQAYGKEFMFLDNSSFDIFYDSLSVTVDQHSARQSEIVSIFYVKEGQRTLEDILQNNIDLRQTSAYYCRLLSELGKTFRTRTGMASYGSKTLTSTNSADIFVFDGMDYCLRWSDAQMEISFITPTGRKLPGDNNNLQQHQLASSSSAFITATKLTKTATEQQQIRNKSKSFASSTTTGDIYSRSHHNDGSMPQSQGIDFEKCQPVKSNRTMSCASTNESLLNAEQSTLKYAKRSPDLRILIVWLERLEDMDSFPLVDLLPFTANGNSNAPPQLATKLQQLSHQAQIDYIVFFLFQFERGLVRVHVNGVWTKYGHPGPLLDGTVVSMEELPIFIRQTVCNIGRRKAVELENYQMTHLRRKQAIGEFGRRFATRLDYPDFLKQFIGLNPNANPN